MVEKITIFTPELTSVLAPPQSLSFIEFALDIFNSYNLENLSIAITGSYLRE